MSDSNFNLDALLDGTLDDLADVPGFQPYPPGTHKVTIKWEKVKDKPAFSLKMTAVETVELSNSEDTPLVPGTMSSVMYMLDNEYGQSNFRKVIASLSSHFGPGSNREIMDKSDGAEVLVVTKLRANKNNKDQVYTDVVELGVI